MTEALTVYGPLGIAVVGLSIAVVHLYRKNQELHAKREIDVLALTGVVTASTAANTRTADVLEEFANRLPSWIRNGRR
jgi:hypothetical protein